MAEPAASSSSSGSFAPRRLHGAGVVRDGLPYSGLAAPPPPLPPVQVQVAASGGGGGGGGGKISPAVLFIIVILAVVFFISGLLHLLVRVLVKKQHRRGGRGGTASSSSAAAARGAGGDAGGADVALQRQLQQLFHLHDSGLDQAFIDALPVFAYREIVVGGGGDGDKEPFDCAVCLCEFDAEDRLRLLPLCGHAFHLNCIDTWLLSNSTCPLCRGVLFVPGLMGEDSPMFDFEERLEEGRLSEDCDDGFGLPGLKASGLAQTPVAEKKVFPVRLGKLKNVGTQGAVEGGNANASARVLSRDQGESSSSSLDGRRCFSMGTYQYVLGTSELRVALQPGRIRNGAGGAMRGRPPGLSSINADIMEGKKICARNKGESFSVSKIWQWSNLKGKLPAGSDECSDAGSLPWMKRGGFTIHHSFSLSVNFMIQKGVKIFISWQVGKGELTPFALVLHPCGRRDHLVSVISLFCIDIQSWWTTRCRVEPRSFHGTFCIQKSIVKCLHQMTPLNQISGYERVSCAIL